MGDSTTFLCCSGTSFGTNPALLGNDMCSLNTAMHIRYQMFALTSTCASSLDFILELHLLKSSHTSTRSLVPTVFSRSAFELATTSVPSHDDSSESHIPHSTSESDIAAGPRATTYPLSFIKHRLQVSACIAATVPRMCHAFDQYVFCLFIEALVLEAWLGLANFLRAPRKDCGHVLCFLREKPSSSV